MSLVSSASFRASGAAGDIDQEWDDDPVPEIECGMTSPTATEREWPHAPCPLERGHEGFCDIRRIEE